MNKHLNKKTAADLLLRGYGRLFDLDCVIEEPLFNEVIENMQKSDAENIAEYWSSVGWYIRNSIETIDREYEKTSPYQKNVKFDSRLNE